MNLSAVLILILLSASSWMAESLRILGVFPMIAKSHYILGSALMRGLAEKGHDITMISPFGEKTKPKNGTYRDIILSEFKSDTNSSKPFNLFDFADMNTLIYIMFMNFLGNAVTEFTFNDPSVQELLKSNEHFDVVIVEQFVNDAHKVFAYHYQAPLILFGTFASNAWLNPLVANPAPPSYVPEIMVSFNHLNFFDRMKNSLVNIAGELNRHFLFFPEQNRIMHRYFPDAPDLSKINYNASLVLLNSHVSTNRPVPHVPNMIEIGGFHVQPPKKLPDDLQKYLDDATEGVIYFSMGSTLKSANLPLEKRQAFLEAFATLKQKVLWKWEDDELPGQPPNVKLSKWLPQQDILAHPNVKLFITHGGLLSVIETVYHGVPILAIPIFGDQAINAEEAERNGFALCVHYADITKETLSVKINDLLHNSIYRDNVKKRSKMFHDRPNTPIDTAAYWVEYVVRHKGGQHFRIAALDLSWYQYISLDIFVFLISAIILVIYLINLLVKKICSIFCKTKSNKKEKKH